MTKEEEGKGKQQPPPGGANAKDNANANANANPQQQNKKEKKKPKNIVIPPKKPKLTKAERRAKQEEQRAAKAGGGGGKKKGGVAGGANGEKKAAGNASKRENSSGAGSGTSNDANVGVNGSGSGNGNDVNKTLNFFSHLPPYKDHTTIKNEFSGVVLGNSEISNSNSHTDTTATPSSNKNAQPCHNNSNLHPAILSLGLQYTTGTIRGANARAKAMLNTFKIAILDYKPSPVTESTTSSSTSSTSPSPNKKKTQNKKPKDIRYSIEHDLLKPAFNYFSNTCRTHSVTMGNAFRFLKQFVLNLDRDLSLQEIQSLCCEAIDEYIFQRIVISGTLICEHASKKIVDGDVILTYARSEVIQVLLLETHENFQKENKSFRVILVDSRPLLEGRKTLDVLTKAGIECTYIFLNSLSYVMKEVTKVFMGAAALMSDGSILSRVGTASVALMARSNNIPVLFCCESYKISSRVQLESITGNELGNPDDLISTYCAIDKNRTGSSSEKDEGVLKDWRSMKSLSLLNLLYDLTPSEFVSGIITEMGILPPTSVAVLLREMMPQDGFKGDVLV